MTDIKKKKIGAKKMDNVNEEKNELEGKKRKRKKEV